MNTCGCINRNIQFFSQITHSFDMVSMIVRYKYRTNTIHQDIIIFQCFFDSTYADSGIYQYSIGFSTQIITVPTTATRQAYKFYFHVLSSLLKCKMPSTFTAK